MIDIIFGKKSNPKAVSVLVDELRGLELNGSLYIGYPIFDINDDSQLTDALLVTIEHGVIAFDLTTSSSKDSDEVESYQDDIYRGLLKRFFAEKNLVIKRELSFKLVVLSLRADGDALEGIDCTSPGRVAESIKGNAGLTAETFRHVNAAIQKTSVLKPQKKRLKVKKEDSYGAVMKSIEKEIANLDHWQKKAAIESPDKPQRIRGLAGCGKTIILAMKAAYIHAYAPDLKVCVTFQTRSLYQQIEKLIDRFYFEHVQDEKDPDYLKIRHAWGSNAEVGVYSEICNHIGIEPQNFTMASNKYGKDKAFEGVCAEVLARIKDLEVEPLYDYLLIDEAQDFPVAFFNMVYRFVKSPHRIVWAYDELQNLGDFVMLPPEKLFGTTADNMPLVSLVNEAGKPLQDIMLPICYRNPPWTLTLALALGLGIYKEQGLVRMFPEPNLWKDIGYEIVGGELKLGREVSLQRSRDRAPSYFEELITPRDSITYSSFPSKEDEAIWIADQVVKNVTQDELECSDIMIVFPSAYTLASDSAYVIHELRKRDINCHIAGKNTSRDILFVEGSIAICHIHRAKGNEAPMVYVANANYCNTGFDVGKKRNSLFTAITRAKAWVRITGTGSSMDSLVREIDCTFARDFQLHFSYPTAEGLNGLEDAYKDKTDDEKQELYEGFGRIKDMRKKFLNGEISIDDIPADLRDFFEPLA